MATKKYFLLILVPISLVFQGCGTPLEIKAVQKYSEFKKASAELFPKISEDVYQSCIRSVDYVNLNPQSITGDREDREVICNDSKSGSVALRKAYAQTHDVIYNYLNSLGDLAADNLTNYDTEVNAVGESIKKLPGLGEGQRGDAISAGTALTRLLFKNFTNNYRRRELKKTIIEADPSLTTLVVALDTSIKKFYVMGLLETERNSLDSYYKLLINPVLNQPQDQNVAIRQYVTENLKSKWSEKQEVVREKQVIASDYLKLLKGIACDHSNLKNLFLKAKNKSGENVTCDKTPGLKSLFASSKEPFPEMVVQLIESYSNTVVSLNKKAKIIYSNN